MNGHAQLRRLCVALEARAPLPPDVAAWLLEGVGAFLAGGGKPPLCVLLGLRGPGMRSAGTRQALAIRDRWLVEAAQFVVAADVSLWTRACRLAEACKRFESDTWPRLRRHDAPPPDARGLRLALWHAFAAGQSVPRSPVRLQRILNAAVLAEASVGESGAVPTDRRTP